MKLLSLAEIIELALLEAIHLEFSSRKHIISKSWRTNSPKIHGENLERNGPYGGSLHY